MVHPLSSQKPLEVSIAYFGFPYSLVGKESACGLGVCNAGNPGSIPGLERSLEKEMATHSSILAQEIPWTEESGGLQSRRWQTELDTT